MLIGDELHEYIVMPNNGSRQGWVGGAGYPEGPEAEEREEKETEGKGDPASD
jgi:hypothetical protein